MPSKKRRQSAAFQSNKRGSKNCYQKKGGESKWDIKAAVAAVVVLDLALQPSRLFYQWFSWFWNFVVK